MYCDEAGDYTVSNVLLSPRDVIFRPDVHGQKLYNTHRQPVRVRLRKTSAEDEINIQQLLLYAKPICEHVTNHNVPYRLSDYCRGDGG